MTLEEKVEQLKQYNGFWGIIEASPKDGQAAKKKQEDQKGIAGIYAK